MPGPSNVDRAGSVVRSAHIGSGLQGNGFTARKLIDGTVDIFCSKGRDAHSGADHDKSQKQAQGSF